MKPPNFTRARAACLPSAPCNGEQRRTMIPLHDNITSKTKPFITWALILLNCYFFYIELKLPNPAALENFLTHWGVVPVRLWGNLPSEWRTLVSATFLHGGWMHITMSLGVRTIQDVGGVAWWAHGAGFVAGLLLGPALSKSKPKPKGARS